MKPRCTRWSVPFVAALIAMAGVSVAGAQTVTRGPYLSVGTTEGVVIRWRTDVATDSRVQYGIGPTLLTESVDLAGTTTEHEIELTGLDPGKSYYYSVGSSAGPLAGGDFEHYFRTNPAVGTSQPVRVWVIGDSGQPGSDARDVRDAYLDYPGSNHTDVWLMLGDNAYNSGTDGEYQAGVFNMYSMMLRNTIVSPTRGNHDGIHSGNNNDYYEIFTLPDAAQAGGLVSGTEAYYAFDFANVHFVCLDSEGSNRSSGGPMLTWLADDLAATTQEWIIAYFHHPPYTKGSHDSDDAGDSGGRMREMRENALPILEAGGADLVLTGHSHSYERSFLLDGHYGPSGSLLQSMKVDDGDGRIGGDGAYVKPTAGKAPNEGTVYTVAGSSSKTSGGSLNHPVMIASLNSLGSVVLDINANQLNSVFLDDNGNVDDEFTIIKGITPTEVPPPTVSRTPRLGPASPNPFAADTRLKYSLPSAGPVQLRIYDVNGRLVRTLVSDSRPGGDYYETWNGVNDGGERVAVGVYFAVLRFAGERRTRKLVLAR